MIIRFSNHTRSKEELLVEKIKKSLNFKISFANVILVLSAGICIVFLIVAFKLPFVFAGYDKYSSVFYQAPANLSATLYNSMSPFIAIVAALLTFMAFWTQYKANQEMLKNNAKQEVERQFYEMLRIHKENVKELKCKQWTISESSNPNFIRCNDSLLEGKFYHNDKYAYKDIEGRQVFLYLMAEYILIEKSLRDAVKIVKANENLNVDLKKYEHYKEVIAFAYTIFYEGMDEIRSYFGNDAKKFFNKCDSELDDVQKLFEAKGRLSLKKYPLKKEYLFDDKNGRIYLYFYFFLCLSKKRFNPSSSKTNLERTFCGYDLYNGHAYELNHYYRHLYQMVKIVANYDNSIIEKKEKKKYLKMLRAQLTGNEQLMLLYNWFSGYGCDWESDKNHFFTDYRMIHNINIEDCGIIAEVGYEKVVERIKKENPDYREYENGCLFEFEEVKIKKLKDVYNRKKKFEFFNFNDLLPQTIEKIIGQERYVKTLLYVMKKYKRKLSDRISKDDYKKAITDIQNYIKQMFVWED